MKNRSGIKRSIYCIALTAMMIAGLAACGKNEKADGNIGKPEGYGKIELEITNKIPDRISALAVSWAIDGETVGTTGVEVADGSCLGEDSLEFPICGDEVTDEKDLEKLSITVKITESDGGSFDVATMALPSRWGDWYKFELRYEDGRYSVWQIFDDGVEARRVTE